MKALAWRHWAKALGGRTRDSALLEEAVAACRVALTAYCREHVPLDWATTQDGLGNALRALVRVASECPIRSSPTRLRRSVTRRSEDVAIR